MSQKSIILIVTLFALLVAGMFIFASLKKSQLDTALPSAPDSEPTSQVLYPDITRIDAKGYYLDGTHTLVGEIIFPTPCDLLEVAAVVKESAPEQVDLNFTVVNNSADCERKATAQRFKVSFDSSAEAEIKAYFMDREVELNIIPAAAGETPDEFEVFIKG